MNIEKAGSKPLLFPTISPVGKTQIRATH